MDSARLLHLLEMFSHTTPYRVWWEHMEEFRKHADNVKRSWATWHRHGDPHFKSNAEQEERFSDTRHRCAMDLVQQLNELHSMVVEAAPRFLGLLPTLEAGTPPTEQEFKQWAANVKTLAGELLATRNHQTPTPDPLLESEREVLEIIKAHPNGIQGKAIIKRMKSGSNGFDKSSLDRIIKKLKKRSLVKNMRGAGYFCTSTLL